MRVRVSSIEWDKEVDGEIQDVDLPSEMIVEIDDEDAESEEMLYDAALDAVSNATGFCVLNSSIEPLEG